MALSEIQIPIARDVITIALKNKCRVEIHFNKTDGSERTLIAVPFDHIPEDKLPKAAKEFIDRFDDVSPTYRIFCEVEQEWRSVRLESINTVKILL